MSELNAEKTIENLENIILLARKTILEIQKTMPKEPFTYAPKPMKQVELFNETLKTLEKRFYPISEIELLFSNYCLKNGFRILSSKKLAKNLKLLGTIKGDSVFKKINGKSMRGYYLE